MLLQRFYSDALCWCLLSGCVRAGVLTKSGSRAVKFIVNFGDSYSQTGFSADGPLPSASNPLGNPTFPGWTTSNGNRYNWLDTLVAKENKTLTYALNLASGGATTDATLVTPYAPYPTVQSLINQTNTFLTSFKANATAFPWNADNTIFTVWIGVNDVGNGWYQPNWPTLVQALGAKYFEQVYRLYDAGARKFALLSVPPIYLTPAILTQGNYTHDAVVSALQDYNDMLGATAAGSLIGLPNAQIKVVDTTPAFLKVLEHPKKYGVANATCYSETGTQCAWFNDYHPGQLIHDEVAKAVAKAVKKW